MIRRRSVLAVAAMSVAVAACTAPESTLNVAIPSSVRSITSTPSPAASGQAPRLRSCYRLPFDQLAKPTNDSRPVSCASAHNTMTIHVGRLDTVVNGQRIAVDSKRAQREMARTCPHKLASFLGGDREDRALSRFSVVWFSPTIAEADRGASWFRCDLIAFAATNTLARLPSRGRLRSVLSHGESLRTYGLCGTAAPGAADFERVICSRRHSWRAISAIRLTGGTAYPGRVAVARAGDASCRKQVRAAGGFAMRFRYGWEWPNPDQWKSGQHYGFCWAPD